MPSRHPPVRILGRDDFIADLVSDLQGGRLITVVGAGGVGKTTVAQCAAREMLSSGHVEHIAFVDLENIHAAEQLLPRFFGDLGLGVSYRGWTDVESFLDNRRILIVIDHCDHVINGAADVIEEMLAIGPNVRVLCTSREPLHAAGERIRRLDGLRVPEDLKALTASQGLDFPSIQFFVERAIVVDPSFTLTDSSTPYIASICSKLDGCPLEIEIAAARTDAFDLPALADVIDGPLRLKMRGGTASRRHRSLEASMDWSFETLALEERLILQRLAVFMGSFTLEAARQITGFGDISMAEVGDVIARLASKSLVASTSNGLHGRRRLAATTRIYAGEKLDRSGERATLARRHATYYAALLITACGNSDSRLDCGNDIDQLQAALAWTESPAGDDELHMLLNLGAVRLENRLDLKPKKPLIPPGATSMLGRIPTQDHLAELAAKRLRQEAMSIPELRSDAGLYTSAFYRDARSSEALIAGHCRFGSRGLEGNTQTTMERLWQPG